MRGNSDASKAEGFSADVKTATQSLTREGKKPWYVAAPVASIIAASLDMDGYIDGNS